MGRTTARLPGFCLNRVATRAGRRVRSPPTCEAAPPISSPEKEPKGAAPPPPGRRIMIVADSTPEAKSALQWALTHTVQSHDTILLLDVVKPSKHGDKSQRDQKLPKDNEILNAMKNLCQAKRPEVQVEVSLVEGKERGPTIVEEARKQGASLLVMGQKQRSITWRLLMVWATGSRMGGGSSGVVEYCVQNSTCMTLAVRRKSKKGGGYLITTRRHKDFWLLA